MKIGFTETIGIAGPAAALVNTIMNNPLGTIATVVGICVGVITFMKIRDERALLRKQLKEKEQEQREFEEFRKWKENKRLQRLYKSKRA